MTKSTASLVSQLGELIGAHKIRIAVAESCTGGMLCGALTANPDVSSSLERGFVVYSPDSKCELLGLDKENVEACDGVSKEVSEEMAAAALERSRALVSVATTGFAGPREKDEEVGLVHLAIAMDNGAILHCERHFGDQGREQICELAVQAALQMLIDALLDENGGHARACG